MLPVIHSNQQVPEITQWQWITIDPYLSNSSIPCLFRPNDQVKRLLSVRIINSVLLSEYVNEPSPEASRFGPLSTFECTQNELYLLNDINFNHVDKLYGSNIFTQEDRLVGLDQFLRYYEIIKRTVKRKNSTALEIQPVQHVYTQNLTPPLTPLRREDDLDENSLFNETYGLIQINDYVLLTIELKDSYYNYDKIYPRCHKYVLLEDLVVTSLVKADELRMILCLKKIKNNPKLVKCKEWLGLKLKKFYNINRDLNHDLELVNILELQFVYFKQPVFLKPLTLEVNKFQCYKKLLVMVGGLVSIETPGKKQVLPYIKINDDIYFVPEFNFERERLPRNSIPFEFVIEFYKLITYYFSIEIPVSLKFKNNFVNIKKFLDHDPNNYRVITRFNSGFPSSWRYGLDSFVQALSQNKKICVNKEPYQEQVQKVRNVEIEAVILSPKSIEPSDLIEFTPAELKTKKRLRSYSESCLIVSQFNDLFRKQTRKPERHVLKKFHSNFSLQGDKKKAPIEKEDMSKLDLRLKRLFKEKNQVTIVKEEPIEYVTLNEQTSQKRKISNFIVQDGVKEFAIHSCKVQVERFNLENLQKRKKKK